MLHPQTSGRFGRVVRYWSPFVAVPRKIWPILIAAAFAAFVLYDLEAGVSIASIVWFIPAIQWKFSRLRSVLATFRRDTRLNSCKASPNIRSSGVPRAIRCRVSSALASMVATGELADFLFLRVLAFITLTPAVLGG